MGQLQVAAHLAPAPVKTNNPSSFPGFFKYQTQNSRILEPDKARVSLFTIKIFLMRNAGKLFINPIH